MLFTPSNTPEFSFIYSLYLIFYKYIRPIENMFGYIKKKL